MNPIPAAAAAAAAAALLLSPYNPHTPTPAECEPIHGTTTATEFVTELQVTHFIAYDGRTDTWTADGSLLGFSAQEDSPIFSDKACVR